MTALRITYETNAGRVSITDVRAVSARVVPSVPGSVLDTGTGVWVEVRDADDERVWGRTLDADTVAGTLRTQAGDGIGGMTRVRVDRLTGTVLVPAAKGGRVSIRSRSGKAGETKTLAEAPAEPTRGPRGPAQRSKQ